jgi:cobalamin biosynthesis Mg chelatase CobN
MRPSAVSNLQLNRSRCRVERLLVFYPGTALRQFGDDGEFCHLRHQVAKERGMVADCCPFACDDHLIGVFVMTIRNLPAAAALIVACLQAGPLLAQSAPAPETAATPAPAASPAPAATPVPEPAPAAAAPTAATSTPPAAASTDKTGANEGKAAASTESAKPRAPKRVRISAQTRHEIAHSLKTGTVPSRYRSQVPKEYQKYIPFER